MIRLRDSKVKESKTTPGLHKEQSSKLEIPTSRSWIGRSEKFKRRSWHPNPCSSSWQAHKPDKLAPYLGPRYVRWEQCWSTIGHYRFESGWSDPSLGSSRGPLAFRTNTPPETYSLDAMALVKEFYANLYDLKDRSPWQCKVRGKTIKFDATTLNSNNCTQLSVMWKPL